MKSQNLDYLNFTREEVDKLFNSAKDGNSSSFNELSKHVRNISYSYFISKHRLGKIRSIEDAEDLTNNVYLAFAEQYHKIENLEFWLRRVLFLNFINWYKKDHAQKTFQLEKAHHLEEKNLSAEDKTDANNILKLLDNFSEEKRIILKLRFWEDLKFSEIAEQLNKSEDAVKKMFYRTIEEIRNML